MSVRKYIAGVVVAAALGLGGGTWYLHHLNKSRVDAAEPGQKALEQMVQEETPHDSTYTPCGNIPCYLPGIYREDYVVACDNYNHCANNNSESTHELEISGNALANGVVGLVKKNPSYVDDDTILLNYKDGTGPGQGVKVKNLLWLVQDADHCNDFKILRTGEPYDKKYEIIALFGTGEDGKKYRIATAYVGPSRCNGGNGDVDNDDDGNNGNGNSGGCNINLDIDINVENNPAAQPTPATATAPEPTPTELTLEEYVAPMLIDNKINEVEFRTGVAYEEIYLAFCEDGTDGKGKVTIPCTKNRRINPNIFPDAVKFLYVSTDENDPNTHTFRGFIPNIPGTKEATYIMVGYKVGGKVYLTDIPEINSTVQNTNPKPKAKPKTRPEQREKKKGIIRRIFHRKN